MANIYDVAKAAQVSTATVSNAFNRPHLMRDATRERILKVAKELDYRPNSVARALAGGKLDMVSLLVADIQLPFVATTTRGIEDELSAHGYIAAISNTDGDEERTIALIDEMQKRGVSGFIVVPSVFAAAQSIIDVLGGLSVPSIFAGRHESKTSHSISFRALDGARELTDHLIKLGHRDIAFITSRHSEGLGVPRWLGFQESLVNHGVRLRPEMIVETEITPQAAHDAMSKLMVMRKPPTAIFAMNGVLTTGVIDFARAWDIRIPTDLSLVSFDYQALVQRTKPIVTSIVWPGYNLGREAAKLMLALNKDPKHPLSQIDIDHQFEVGETTAAPRQV